MLDLASQMIVQTADKSFANKNKITDLAKGQILIHGDNQPLTQVMIQPINIVAFDNAVAQWQEQARTTGSANDAQLGAPPASGTPFALQNLVTYTGQGIHEYRRGKIATFLGEIYRDWLLKYLVDEMNQGHQWLDELDLNEMQYVANAVATEESNKAAVDMIIKYLDGKGEIPTQEIVDTFKNVTMASWLKDSNKKFIEVVENEFKNIPIDVEVSIAGKQKDLGKMAQGLTNIFRQIFANPSVLQNKGMADLFNQIVEASGLEPVNFAGMESQSAQTYAPMSYNQFNENTLTSPVPAGNPKFNPKT
jgi:hypothetical protein